MALSGTLPARRTLRVRLGIRSALHTLSKTAARTVDRLSGSVLTIAGLGCVDVGAFTGNTIVGWVVTGLTVLLLDWKLE